MYRSVITTAPRSSAGSMTVATCSARSAAYSRASACADMPPICAVSSSSARSRIPIFVAPGSCVATTSYPCSRSQIAVSLACVVLPEPSPPSNAMNSPAGPGAGCPSGGGGGGHGA